MQRVGPSIHSDAVSADVAKLSSVLGLCASFLEIRDALVLRGVNKVVNGTVRSAAWSDSQARVDLAFAGMNLRGARALRLGKCLVASATRTPPPERGSGTWYCRSFAHFSALRYLDLSDHNVQGAINDDTFQHFGELHELSALPDAHS